MPPLNALKAVDRPHLLQSITLLAHASRLLAEKALAGMIIHTPPMAARVEQNPILVTALTPVIGFDRAA